VVKRTNFFVRVRARKAESCSAGTEELRRNALSIL
jgi:hypothetical protein